MLIYPVLLCGGSGTRLWPVSRQSYPKQFVKLLEDKSLFQASASRFTGANFAEPVIITNDRFRFIVTEQLAELDLTSAAMLIEPEGRNTAPAVLAAAMWLERHEPNALMLIAPSDHVIGDTEDFSAAVTAAAVRANKGDIVTFGTTPTRPETGYGYLELAEQGDKAAKTPLDLASFVEKPDPDTARQMVASGRYLWNAGIFLVSVQAVLAAYRDHAEDMVEMVAKAFEMSTLDLGFVRLDPDYWSKLPDISIDYAIMERATNLAVMPYSGTWSDLGGWDAVWRESAPDAEGNVTSERATAIDCRDTLLRSDSPNLEVVGMGLEDLTVIAMSDAVLVAHKSQSQRVKCAVNKLKAKGASQAVQLPRDYRPWGWYESLIVGNRFQVKRIVVHPGAALSLQSHVHRSEHWIVVKGTAQVTVDDEVKLVTENESVYIPLGAIHRMENPGKMPLTLIEVQTGSYLGEDDIVRYEDVYQRGGDEH